MIRDTECAKKQTRIGLTLDFVCSGLDGTAGGTSLRESSTALFGVLVKTLETSRISHKTRKIGESKQKDKTYRTHDKRQNIKNLSSK